MIVGLNKMWRLPLRRAIGNTLLAAFASLAFIVSSPRAQAQAMPTATRIGDLQFGGGIAFGASTYNFTTSNLIGESAYAALDIRNDPVGQTLVLRRASTGLEIRRPNLVAPRALPLQHGQ